VVTNIFAQMILETKKAIYAFVFKKEQSRKTSQRKERRKVMFKNRNKEKLSLKKLIKKVHVSFPTFTGLIRKNNYRQQISNNT